MNLKPLQDRIVVKPDTRELSSVIFVDNKEVDNMGTVIAVGAGKVRNGRREEMPVEVGARVRFGTMNNDRGEEYLQFPEYFEDGQRYLIMSWQDVCFMEDANV
jgi:co-chaperonin GroES (HSP10)